MQYSTLVEMVGATHLSQYVKSIFLSRGGLFLVAPPGSVKTTIVQTMDAFRGTLLISDANVRTIVDLKEYMVAERVRTLAFPEYEKLYKRHKAVASNVEGIIMALAEEGFRKAAFEPQISSAVPARCTIIGGMTTRFYENWIYQWNETGFGRRFLFARYQIKGIEVMEQAIMEHRFAKFMEKFDATTPDVREGIPYTTTKRDTELIDRMTRHITYRNNSLVLLQKIVSVLKWKFDEKKAHAILHDFAPCLSKDGGILDLVEC